MHNLLHILNKGGNHQSVGHVGVVLLKIRDSRDITFEPLRLRGRMFAPSAGLVLRSALRRPDLQPHATFPHRGAKEGIHHRRRVMVSSLVPCGLRI